MSVWIAVGLCLTVAVAGRIASSLNAVPAAAGPAPAGGHLLGERVGRIADRRIRESSGIVKSRRFEGVYWTHNDSGDSPRIFAIGPKGKLIREVRIRGVVHRDWEDIAIDDSGNLYVGDIGNNTRRHKVVTIVKIAEPDPRAGDTKKPLTVTPAATYPCRYAAGRFDAEGLFVLGGRIFITNKVYNGNTGLYRLDDPKPRQVNRLKRVGEVRLLSITAADANPAGTRIALLNYGAVTVFNVPAAPGSPLRGKRWLLRTGWRITGQAEAICFDNEGLRITNEQGSIFYLPAEQINRHLPQPTTRSAQQ
jgi:hypothetical protein